MPTKERMEHLNDVADGDAKGWRRRGDFKSDAEWQAGVNAKPDTATTRRTYADQKARAQSAVTSRQAPQSLGGGSSSSTPPQGSPAVASTAPATPASVSARETNPTPAPAIVPEWHEGTGHDDDGTPGAGSGGSSH